jgi:hypothetical protein
MKRQNFCVVFHPSHMSERFFARYASIIVHNRCSVSKGVITTRLKQLLELLLEREGSGLDSVRQQYSADLCTAVSGIKDPECFICIQTGVSMDTQSPEDFKNALENCLPAAAAAVGNVSLLQTLTWLYDAKTMLGGSHRNLPRAFNVAVASDQTEVVTRMLENPRGRKTWDRVSVRSHLVQALQIAVGTFNQTMGNIILDYLFVNDARRPTLGQLKNIVRDCMIYGNVDLLEQILEGRKILYPEFEQYEAQNGLAISAREMEVLYYRGSRSGILDILGIGFMCFDEMGRHLPLDRTMYYD